MLVYVHGTNDAQRQAALDRCVLRRPTQTMINSNLWAVSSAGRAPGF